MHNRTYFAPLHAHICPSLPPCIAIALATLTRRAACHQGRTESWWRHQLFRCFPEGRCARSAGWEWTHAGPISSMRCGTRIKVGRAARSHHPAPRTSQSSSIITTAMLCTRGSLVRCCCPAYLGDALFLGAHNQAGGPGHRRAHGPGGGADAVEAAGHRQGGHGCGRVQGGCGRIPSHMAV